MKQRIQEVIVVEGKDDTAQLHRYFDVDTFETNGTAVSKQQLQQLQHLQQQRGLIILTDPDFSGERIRQRIASAIPEAKHAFITKKEGKPSHKGSLGVEHATQEALYRALQHVMTPSDIDEWTDGIPEQWLWDSGLRSGHGAKERRQRLGEALNIGYTNGKQLYQRLRMFRISRTQFEQAVRQLWKEHDDATNC